MVYLNEIVTQPTDRAPSQEEVLVVRARDGDEGAFGELVTRYQALAARVARLVAPGIDVDDAEPLARAAVPARPVRRCGFGEGREGGHQT